MPSPQPVPIPFGSGQWSMWPDFVLRSAGFPFGALHAALAVEPAGEGFDGADARVGGRGRARGGAGPDAVRMPLLWQTPGVLALWVDWLLPPADQPARRNVRRRASEHTV